MIEFDTTVRIDRARERVFGILADFESKPGPLGQRTGSRDEDSRRWRGWQPLHNHSQGRSREGPLAV